MKIITETFGNVLVAHAPDELTEDSTGALVDTVHAAFASGQTAIVLQMENSETFDSSGLTQLADLQDELREENGSLTMCGLSETGRTIFRITRLEHEFEICESVIDAVTRLQSNQRT